MLLKHLPKQEEQCVTEVTVRKGKLWEPNSIARSLSQMTCHEHVSAGTIERVSVKLNCTENNRAE
jgi:hypothetical protein